MHKYYIYICIRVTVPETPATALSLSAAGLGRRPCYDLLLLVVMFTLLDLRIILAQGPC